MVRNMPTLMSRSTFDDLTTVWHDLLAKTPPGGIGPSNIFVPWAGEQLVARSRGIYFVGIATDADDAEGEPSFEAGLRFSEDCLQTPRLRRTNFWQFINRLTGAILGGPYYETQDRWGWSNLLKIAGTKETPGNWPATLIEGQRSACIAALKEEIANLRHSLILITSRESYGIAHEAFGDKDRWENQSHGAYLRQDAVSRNVFVHCWHPKYLSFNQQLLDTTLTEIIRAAREKLTAFT